MAVTRVYVGHTTTRDKILAFGLLGAMMVFGFVGSSVIGPGIYQSRMSQLDLAPGSVGSRGDESVPVVSTLEEMEQGGKFVLRNEEFGDWTKNSGNLIEDTYYNKIPLKDGTVIAARINLEAEDTEIVTGEPLQLNFDHEIVTYPVGILRPWPSEEALREAKAADWITYKKGYLDMEGDFGKELPDLEKIKENAMLSMLAAGLVSGLAVCVIIDLHYKKKEALDSTPQTDQERWILGTYAIWAQFFGQLNYKGKLTHPNTPHSPLYLGGKPKDGDSRKFTIKVLKRDWDIKNREDLLETVEYMSRGTGFWDCKTQYDRAWELCRSTQLLGMGYIAGWLTREELTERSSVVGNIIQRTFEDWQELAQSYLEAYARWRARMAPDGDGSAVRMRNQIYQNLCNRKDSPYRLPWMLPLGTDGVRMEPVKEKTGEV